MEQRRVFIVGYMGAGKSTSGARLARMMDLPFFDTDALLREEGGCSIPALFERHGEDGFRALERDVLRALVDQHARCLISTGGGTPCHGDNLSFMKENGTVVYLKMPVERLVQRLDGRADERPLIAGVSSADLPAFIANHLGEREQHYGQAHITVDADHLDGDRMKSVQTLIEGRAAFSP